MSRTRPILAALLAFGIVAASWPITAAAQDRGGSEGPVLGAAGRETPGDQVTPAQEARLADAVRDVRDNFSSNRMTEGFGDLIGGVIVGALGGYIAFIAFDDEPADFGIGLLGLGIAGYGLHDIVSGIWKFAYATPQERIAQKLLDDPAQLRASGMLFLEQEAFRARRERLVGGSLSIVAGVSGGLILIPLMDQDQVDPFLVGLIGLSSGIQVISGLFTLIGQSGPEKRFEELENAFQKQASLTDFRVVPTLVASPDPDDPGETTLGPGVAMGFRF